MTVQTAHALAVRGREPAGDERRQRDGCHGVSEGEDHPTEPLWVGVTRAPPAWFRRRVDVHCPALALSDETEERLVRRRRDLRMRGLCEEGAHNAAWEELGIDERYRARLTSGAPREQLERLVTRARLLVFASDRRPGFRCHRTVLADVVEAAFDGP